MVYEEHSKKLCHDLAELGKEAYQELIAKEADMLLVDAEHGILAFFVRLLNALGFNETFVLRRYDRFLLEIEADRQ